MPIPLDFTGFVSSQDPRTVKPQPVVQPNPQNPASLQGTVTTPQQPALPQAPQTTGVFALSQVLNVMEQKVRSNNALMTQRNLLLKYLYNTPDFTAQDRQQLDPTFLQSIDSGDRNRVDMDLRLISDEVSGRAASLDSSVKYLTDAYQQEIQMAEQKRKDAASQAEFIIKNTPSAVLRKTYSTTQLDQLGQALGMPIGSLSDPNFKTDKDIQLQTSATAAGSLSLAREAMAASRYGSTIKSTITSFYPSGKSPIQTYGVSSQAINRIDQSLTEATDPANPNKGAADLDLVDAYVQIARGGQAITEAQVDTLLRSLGIKAKFDVGLQKITGTAILDDGTRREIAKLSHKIFAGQEQLAKKATDAINKQLTKQKIPSDYLLQSPEEAASFYNLTDTGLTDQGLISGGSVVNYGGQMYQVDANGDLTPIQ